MVEDDRLLQCFIAAIDSGYPAPAATALVRTAQRLSVDVRGDPAQLSLYITNSRVVQGFW